MPAEARRTFVEHIEAIEDEIDTPRSVSEDGITVTTRSAEDIIRMANYTRSSHRMRYGLGACINQQIRPPDALGQNTATL